MRLLLLPLRRSMELMVSVVENMMAVVLRMECLSRTVLSIVVLWEERRMLLETFLGW